MTQTRRIAERVAVTTDGFTAGGTTYRRLEVAAARIGIHPQSLQRLWRNSGADATDRIGLKLGRQLFFADTHLYQLGYPVKKNKEEQGEGE